MPGRAVQQKTAFGFDGYADGKQKRYKVGLLCVLTMMSLIGYLTYFLAYRKAKTD